MEKIQLHSKLTFLRKYILSSWMIFAGVFMLYATISSQNWIAVIIILLVINGIVYTVRKFLFPLRNVFLDKVNRKMLVEYRNEMIEIPISEIGKIEEQSRLGKILNVKLNLKTKFGSELIFVPKNNNIIREILELKNITK